MLFDDILATVGHEVHVCRFREARTLRRWLGDVRGKTVVDVAGGDGYWAGRLRRRGARAVSVDLSSAKLRRGRRISHAPHLVEGDAQRLPVASGAADAVLSVCALEHFADPARAVGEMARILRPGGRLVLSADALTRGERWPHLLDVHRERFDVRQTFSHTRLAHLLDQASLDVLRHEYQFRSATAERAYLELSAHGGRLGFTAAAPATPFVALSDALHPNTRGSIVLVCARKRGYPRAGRTT
ncbi:class I SAM-dependent methyltransferase [Spiractinospora alimapuensis]|uniref:class I SAM-dependent methyltransferase n=1 Tax=Spiractinospora alimapuensis TaxID=2820884 RepID=UPI001F368E18|nr:class I SAM-dependent methyltransferase [Spiractinospora alimapuensis]QVQ54387.1 class I SAM-dependent methyltransferase [Spiractinospora alimapuensis]